MTELNNLWSNYWRNMIRKFNYKKIHKIFCGFDFNTYLCTSIVETFNTYNL